MQMPRECIIIRECGRQRFAAMIASYVCLSQGRYASSLPEKFIRGSDSVEMLTILPRISMC